MNRALGILAAGLFVLAWMIVWGYLIRTYALTLPQGSRLKVPFAGLVYDVG